MNEATRRKPQLVDVPLVALSVGVAALIAYFKHGQVDEIAWAARYALLANAFALLFRYWLESKPTKLWLLAFLHLVSIPMPVLFR